MKTLRIATRQSPLALWQAHHVAGLLQAQGASTQLVPLVSGGDTDMRPIDGTRQVGVFTKRIQQAVIDGEADIAVHSLKDLPTQDDDRLELAGIPQRESVSDCLVSSNRYTLETLPPNARVGTGSRRRGAQLLYARPDLQILPIRGNVQTRLAKLEDREFDAIMLAHAGILRLQMQDLAHTIVPLESMLPAPGQGALGIEVRSDDPESAGIVTLLNHDETRAAVTAERLLLAALQGGCLAPIAAYGRVEQNRLSLNSVVLSPDGKQRLQDVQSADFDASTFDATASELASRAAETLLAQGAAELIAESR